MNQYYLAIDIGASSGRHILAHMEDGKMILEEVHRFPNGMVEVNGEFVWDTEALFAEIKAGLKKCKELGKVPVSVGVDTWGVDFALLDKEGKLIGNVVAYRDSRTKGMDDEVYKIISEEDLYARTGIQKQMYNTIYQLMAVKVKKPEELAQAQTMLMTPDYFHYLLSGKAAEEYTIATTGQLVSPVTKDWDMELIEKLGYPKHIFQKLMTPGTVLGYLTPQVQEEVGFNCKVVLPAAHDTASAVLAVPTSSEDTLYISSGTWSLLGIELKEANCSQRSKECNLTNEGGYDYRFRYLKNIMGLWMIQSVKKEIGGSLGYGEICDMASRSTITSIVDCNDDRFMAPKNMTEEIQAACRESGQQVPETLADVAAVVYNSLAKCYAATTKEIEEIIGKKFDRIHIVGGGSNADYLNRLTARETGLTVYAGPGEGTAIGNVAAQMIADGVLKDIWDARACVFRSFGVVEYPA
ncbi:MAG: rhamnulokinase [Lachnospiraceae bacterium]|nr:rhamnulokinase [Lachnospiraceae bacterium]